MFMKQIAGWLPKSGFLRSVATLTTGTGIAQGIMLAAAPILTRLYGPEDFGLLATYMAIFAGLSVLSCWSYQFSIVLPKSEEDAVNLLLLVVGIVIAMSAIVLVLVSAYRLQVAALLGAPGLSDILWLLPISLFGVGLFQAFTYWSIRQESFKSMAVARISQSTATVAMQLASGLVVGLVFGQLMGAAVLARKVFRKDILVQWSTLPLSRTLQLARRYWKFPLFVTWPSVLDNMTQWMPILYFTKFFDIAVSGQYALTIRLLAMPASLLGEAVGQVNFQRMAKSHNLEGNIGHLVEETASRLFLIAVAFCVPVIALAPPMFELVLGEPWRTAGVYAQILAPAIGLRFVVSPLTRVFGVKNRQEISAIWKATAFVATLGTLSLGLLFDQVIWVIVALTINDLLLYTVYLILVFRAASASFRNMLKYMVWAV